MDCESVQNDHQNGVTYTNNIRYIYKWINLRLSLYDMRSEIQYP